MYIYIHIILYIYIIILYYIIWYYIIYIYIFHNIHVYIYIYTAHNILYILYIYIILYYITLYYIILYYITLYYIIYRFHNIHVYIYIYIHNIIYIHIILYIYIYIYIIISIIYPASHAPHQPPSRLPGNIAPVAADAPAAADTARWRLPDVAAPAAATARPGIWPSLRWCCRTGQGRCGWRRDQAPGDGNNICVFWCFYNFPYVSVCFLGKSGDSNI